MSLISCKNISKIYKVNTLEIKALNDISFDIEAGELVVILGSSGAGKSTLLNILGGMDSVSSGDYFVAGNNISTYSNKELMRFRRNDIGFVFQFYNLMPNLNAIENVMLSHPNVNKDMALEVLKKVGLEDRIYNFPSELSGGEQQRVAIARALVKSPQIILCDEPTGALDSKTGDQIIDLLRDMSIKENKTVIIVTHNASLANIANRVIRISDGQIIENYLKNE